MSANGSPGTSQQGTSEHSKSNPRKRKHLRHIVETPLHPYVDMVDKAYLNIKAQCEKILLLSDNDMVLCNRRTGVNDYEPNLEFAVKLEYLAKKLIEVSNKCSFNAQKLRDIVQVAKDKKNDLQDIVFMTEVTDVSKKCKEALNKWPRRVKYTMEIKSEIPRWPVTISSDESDDDGPLPGDPDTRFMYIKNNSNNRDKVQFQCADKTCRKVFRDSVELNNHVSVHQYDLFRCLKCFEVACSAFSFRKHMDKHNGTENKCTVCDRILDLKSSLINHMQMHRMDKVVCQTCQKEFKYRQTGIEHIQWAHCDKKEVPCPICKKMFQTPTNMRSH